MVVRTKRESEAFDYDEDEDEKNFVRRLNNRNQFIGNDCALSLDGKSLIVPDYGDADDMSSLGANSKYTYRGDDGTVRYIGDMKIVDRAGDNGTDPSAMSSLEKKLSSHYQDDPAIQRGDYDLQIYDDAMPAAERKDTDLSQSFEEKKKEEDEATKSDCIPQWITDAPLWLKLIIIASIALLLGALVLIAVGAQLSSESQISLSPKDENPISGLGDNSIQQDALEDSAPESGSVKATIYPDTPAVMVTSNPSLSPLETISNSDRKVPTNAPSTTLSTVDKSGSKDTSNIFITASPTTTLTTAFPSSSPTTSSPTNAPTTVSPSSKPTTLSPTNYPTKSPTQSPTISTINFFVMGGRFDGEDTKILDKGLKSLPSMDDNTVLIHLGDWNSPYATSCNEDSFITNVDSYRRSSVPVYFVPGDNEYNDCPNPTEALGFWNQYLLDFETKYWKDPYWDVIRQSPDYNENFAFLQREVLFVGINLVGGIIHNQKEWDARHEANLLWIDTTAAKYDGFYTTMVVLAHADPDIEINQNFFKDFYVMVESYDEQVIFVHRNLGIDTWKKETGYNGIPNLEVVAVEGSKWPPMWVQIDPISGTYIIDQSSWYEKYEATGTLPPTP